MQNGVMTLDELDALIKAEPRPGSILLSTATWKATMDDPRAGPYRTQGSHGGVTYRGLKVWVGFAPDQLDRVLDKAETQKRLLW